MKNIRGHKLSEQLDADARSRIEHAIRQAELRSRGEIVPVLVHRSSSYPDAHLRGAVLGAGVALLITVILASAHARLFWVLGAEGVGMLVGYLAASAAPLTRMLIGKAGLEQAAIERAERAFLEHGLAHTEQRTGVLVFASWLERKAVVIGDEAIHEKMGQAEWQHAVDVLVKGIGRGAPAEGFCEAIAIVGDKLAEHFPRKDTDVDELPNQLRIEER